MAKKNTPKKDQVGNSLFVKSVPASFWRCGMQFTREGRLVSLDALTEEQVDRLLAEPNLVVVFSEDSAVATKDEGPSVPEVEKA